MIRSIKQAKKSLQLGSIITFVSILTNTLTFFLLTIFVVFALVSNHVLGFLESRAQLTAYFQDTSTEESILEIKKELVALPEVTDVTYTSKVEALNIFLNLYESEPLLTEDVDAGIFPASLDIRVDNINSLEKIADFLKTKDGVEEISFFKEALEKFKSWSNGIKYIGLTLVLSMLLISFLILFVVTGVGIREKSDEIKVMRLMGATSSYIQGPFFVQSIIIALLSSVFAVVMFMALAPFAEPFLVVRFSGIPIPLLDFLNLLIIFSKKLISLDFSSIWLVALAIL
jgi:cell division transport system permease protein